MEFVANVQQEPHTTLKNKSVIHCVPEQMKFMTVEIVFVPLDSTESMDYAANALLEQFITEPINLVIQSVKSIKSWSMESVFALKAFSLSMVFATGAQPEITTMKPSGDA